MLLIVFIVIIMKTKIFKGNFVNLIAIFLIAMTLSVINVKSYEPYLNIYKDILVASIFSICIYTVITKESIDRIFTYISVFISISLLYQTLYLSSQRFSAFINLFLSDKRYIFASFQENRNKFFDNSFTEIFFPILLYLLTTSKTKIEKFIYTIMIFGQFSIAVASGWRMKIIVIALSLFLFYTFLFHFTKYLKNIIRIFLLCALLLTVFIFLYSQRYYFVSDSNYSIGLNPLEQEDIASIVSRVEMWKEAFNIGFSHPITGAGLGNYYDYVNAQSQENKQSNPITRNDSFIRFQDPHNIFFSYFAMTGLTGLFSICLILISTGLKVITIFKYKLFKQYILYLCFVNILMFSLFNPSTSFNFYIVLLFIVSIIHKIDYLYT